MQTRLNCRLKGGSEQCAGAMSRNNCFCIQTETIPNDASLIEPAQCTKAIKSKLKEGQWFLLHKTNFSFLIYNANEEGGDTVEMIGEKFPDYFVHTPKTKKKE